jgi:lysophospholipase L1-like esterase
MVELVKPEWRARREHLSGAPGDCLELGGSILTSMTTSLRWLRLLTLTLLGAARAASGEAAPWVGSWATAPQPPFAGPVDRYRDQTLRLIVHLSAGGQKVRVRLSNTFGTSPLRVGAASVGRQATGAALVEGSARRLTFAGKASVSIPAGATSVSDPVTLEALALSNLAVSLYLPDAAATTEHALALQTSYVARAKGDSTTAEQLPDAKSIDTWPFLTGVEVAGAQDGVAIVAFGDSTIDGDSATPDANRRWPDVLAQRLQAAGGRGASLGVLNEGLIGNRLLHGSPRQALKTFGLGFGPSGLERFDRDVLGQAGVSAVIVSLGANDLGFGAGVAPRSELPSAGALIAGYRALIARAHARGVRVIGTTITPFENAAPVPGFSSPEKDEVRRQVNAWMLGEGAFDAVVDFDAVLRDPEHPARLAPAFDSGDHVHPGDRGYAAMAAAVPLSLFGLAAPDPVSR